MCPTLEPVTVLEKLYCAVLPPGVQLKQLQQELLSTEDSVSTQKWGFRRSLMTHLQFLSECVCAWYYSRSIKPLYVRISWYSDKSTGVCSALLWNLCFNNIYYETDIRSGTAVDWELRHGCGTVPLGSGHKNDLSLECAVPTLNCCTVKLNCVDVALLACCKQQ